MPKRDDGGPAFPRPASEDRAGGDQPDGNTTADDQTGMSLRDWLAGQALAGMLAFAPEGASAQMSPDSAAGAAYRFADAMLHARKG